MIVQRGYSPAGNLHTARLEQAPLGHFFNVISNGYGSMPDYSAQLSPVDRWAVTAYIRALQLSQKATPADMPAGVKAEPLSSLAETEGLPANFAADWDLPGTAVYGTPDGKLYNLPAQPGGAAPSAGAAMTTPKAKTAAPSAGSTAAKQ
jgi:hypothetical protein